MENELSPQDALQHAGDVGRKTRRPVRTAGWVFLGVGVATMVYWPAGTVATFAFATFVFREDPLTSWLLVALAVLTGLPAVYGGWRILRAAR
ncbi:hypothetical protein ACIBH1_41215 [Nonomuraea sp. NPDC050663]|uniref:hypothetical protein n=1 Tax=Nonomuraea sp. NPDC050663 TaxID=3364370 RepID=UPI0037BDA3C2